MVDILSASIVLALSAFASATILPGSSEVALVVFMESFPSHLWLAFFIATIANSLGSITSLVLGRFIPPKKLPTLRMQKVLQDYGSIALLLAWLPIIGDALPLAAGWLRLKFLPCVLCLMVGKAVRYGLLLILFYQTRNYFT